jgi:hypothetical protein
VRPAPSAAERARVMRAFQELGSVGPRIAEELWDLGYRSVAELVDADPDQMYRRSHELQGGGYLDRCVLYVYRCVVYQARTPKPDPELKKWWLWKERSLSRKT